jgi:predicted lipase
MISHKTVVDLLRITMLVYNYGEMFQVENSDETIEAFVTKLSNDINDLKISETRKQALIDISKNIPSGKVCRFFTDKKTDLQVGITLNDKDKRICVVFRGSESSTDWYYDLQVRKMCLRDEIMVHSGFYHQLCSTGVLNDIIDEVKTQLTAHPDYNIFVTGHSLGAALATMFGYLLSYTVDDKITVVSFASPRVGNASWKKSFEEKANLEHYRITNNRDIVTAFPNYKYKHVGDNIRISENAVTTFLDYQDDSWYDFSVFRCWSAGDHDCDLYYKHLLKNSW